MSNQMAKYHPKSMNIELTTCCALRCPQCYCSLAGGKHIDPNVAIYWINQGAQMGVEHVELSGGESMCYPYLYQVVSAARKSGVMPNVAISGYSFDQHALERLIESGIDGIYVSLNGSTREINSLTRDGFDMAINALNILKINKFPNTTINWVMHCNNADDFPNLIKMAEKYEVNSIVIIGVKPDRRNMMSTLPNRVQMDNIKKIVRNQGLGIKIYIETCYSPMLALVSDTKLFGNLNLGINKGCGAGLSTFSVNVDGCLSPCRHLEIFESYETLREYWEDSPVLGRLRNLAETDPTMICKGCWLKDYCRPCYATEWKINKKICRGIENCPVQR